MNTVIANGFFVGLIYGLLAVGLVVVYRGSRVINFAYGETGMVAAFVFADLRYGTGIAGDVDRGLLFALPAALAVAAAIGIATDVFVARPLRDAPPVRPLVGTFAVASLLLTFAVRRWGTSVRFTEPLVDGGGVSVGDLQVQPGQLLILVVSVVVLAALWLLYSRTAFGLQLRATAQDPYGAGLIGIDVDRTSRATWALGGLLAGASALMIGPLVAFNVLFMTTLTIRAVAAALVGGLTSITGAFAAGVLIGIVEGVITFKSPVSGVTDAVLAAFVLTLMLLRPTGLVRSAY